MSPVFKNSGSGSVKARLKISGSGLYGGFGFEVTYFLEIYGFRRGEVLVIKNLN
jgi:hypothetical protein